MFDMVSSMSHLARVRHGVEHGAVLPLTVLFRLPFLVQLLFIHSFCISQCGSGFLYLSRLAKPRTWTLIWSRTWVMPEDCDDGLG